MGSERLVGHSIIAPRRSNSAHLHRPWRANQGFEAYATRSMADHSGAVVLTNSDNGQSIMPDLVDGFMPGAHPSFVWLHYEHFDAARRRLLRQALARGIEAAWSDDEIAGILSEADRRSLARSVCG